jgi:DNA repair protein RecO (recombination protein O)
VENTLRRFELALLAELGYGVELAVEVDTGIPVKPGEHYHYCPGVGLFARPRSDCVPLTGETIRQLVAGGELGPQALTEAKQLTRRLLAICLDERPLKSRELFETL